MGRNNLSLGVAVVVCGLLAACSTDDVQLDHEDLADDLTFELEPPKRGVQVATVGREIPAGADEEWCEVVQLPGEPDEPLFVGTTEVSMTANSHHLIISVAPPDSDSLSDYPLHEPVPCSGAHEYGQDLSTLAAAALPYVRSDLPEGIGFELRGGQRLLVDYHALNTGNEPFHVEHRLNLHTVDQIERPARTFGFYNQYIRIDPGEAASFTEECRFSNDLLIWALGRHTHRLGTDFRVFWSGGEHDGELIWESGDWEQEIAFEFDEPVEVPAGTGFKFECAFENTTDEIIVFGPEATDEMCILFGSFAAVGDDADVGPQSCYVFTPTSR